MRMFTLLALWLGLAGLSSGLRPVRLALEPPRPVTRAEDVWLQLLGEGRGLLARILWFKMDLLDEELNHMGKLELKEKEVLPLLRLVTYLDPSIEDAYDILAHNLWKYLKREKDALQIAEEGAQRNPRGFLCNWRVAFLYSKLGKWEQTRDFAVIAFRNTEDALQQNSALRLVYHAAVKLNDPGLGRYTVEVMRRVGRVPPSYEPQYQKWLRQLNSPQASPSGEGSK